LRLPIFPVAILLLLAACAHDDGRRNAAELGERGGLQRAEIQTQDFLLVAYSRVSDPQQAVHVYIEGDGLAWISRNRLSDDPTPRRAIGLALAAADPAPNVAYLARPCQYLDLHIHPCDRAYWSGKRYAEEVIRSENEALDELMRKAPGQPIHLIGYSGGAAVAVLLAARRKDVASLRTVAGNLATEAVNRQHQVSAMPGSLDPIDAAALLAGLPQIHFIGSADSTIPAFVATDFTARTNSGACARVVRVEGVTHDVGWSERWPALLGQIPACKP
jgi:hypothetical protein